MSVKLINSLLDTPYFTVSERRALLKRRTECKQKMEKLKLRFGLDEISEDIYKTSIAYLNTEFAEIERCLENANKNLSNLDKFVDRAMLMCCQLGGYFQAITKKKNKKRQMILVICRLLSE